jgi:hypothetical protein
MPQEMKGDYSVSLSHGLQSHYKARQFQLAPQEFGAQQYKKRGKAEVGL